MLTYGGYPLLVPDDDGDLARWQLRLQDLAQTSLFAGQRSDVASCRFAARSRPEADKGIGIPVINWPPRPTPRLNSLYWPTSATRWAWGCFLADDETKDLIVADAHSVGGNTPLTLKWGDDNSQNPPLETAMYLLPPRPLSEVVIPGGVVRVDGWILPLVDARYWWQFISVSDLEVTEATTWSELFSSLGIRLGVTVDLPTAVEIPYLQPDPVEFTRRHDNAAILLEAAASSTGRRIVRRLDGTVRAEAPADAEVVVDTNPSVPWQQVAGGNFRSESGDLPAEVVVTFRKTDDDDLVADGELWTVEKGAPDEAGSQATAARTIHSAAYANHTGDVPTPFNECWLDCLAEKIRDDYYAWRSRRYDYTFAGALDLFPCGFDDAIQWSIGQPIGEDGHRAFTTRVQSLPPDCVAEVQGSQDPDHSTTTTPAPACTGECKWTWVAASNAWTLTTDGCEVTTTTTTTTTTSDPSTTTTVNPCCTSTTTTTTANPCQCTYPRFCGTSDGDCTYTFCSTSEIPEPPIACTTTTSTTSTTTTTCDCNTTTTTVAPAGCADGCDWAWLPNSGGSFSWNLVTNGCTSVDCYCPQPDDTPAECSYLHTDCVQTTTTARPPCAGVCIFWWTGGGWVATEVSCNTSSLHCYCLPPTVDGNECAPILMPCGSPSGDVETTTTTTQAPCASCYTSSTTTSTTTTGPCQSNCTWRWSESGNAWSLIANPCNPSCSCRQPAIDGHDDCEVTQTPCRSGTTTTSSTTTTTTTTTTSTTTTTTTTTTTSTTTSTTTTCPPAGAPGTCEGSPDLTCCVYVCTETGWEMTTNNCAGGDEQCFDANEGGCDPCGPGNVGECCAGLACLDATTTTTTTPPP